MARVRIDTDTWLVHGRVRSVEDVVFWELPELPVILPADDDFIHVIRTGDRIDRLAASPPLNDPHLFWTIMLLNDMRLFPNDFEEGRQIRIPTYRRLVAEGIVSAGT